jgi:CheY-like chemotaxis protein
MRVLIAEDDITSRSILTAILGKWGYEVGEERVQTQSISRVLGNRYLLLHQPSPLFPLYEIRDTGFKT